MRFAITVLAVSLLAGAIGFAAAAAEHRPAVSQAAATERGPVLAANLTWLRLPAMRRASAGR